MAANEYLNSIIIERPIDEVFSTATCLESCVNWQTFMVNAEKVSEGPVHVGSQYKHSGRFLGMTGDAFPVVTALEPPHLFAYENDGRFPFNVEYRFESVPEGTRMTCKMYVPPGNNPIIHMAMPLLMNALSRQFTSDLQSLKEMMEAGVKVRKW